MLTVELTEIFDKWYKKLRDAQAKSAIDVRLVRMAKGNFGDCKSLGNSLYEIRIHCGAGYRLYFVNKSNKWILILCGGNKATQNKDIEKAKKLARELTC
jgi:putative addiction module killer protein